MKVSIPFFKGVIPRIASRLLPDGHAERAINARLVSGDLTPWREPEEVETLQPSSILSIYRMQTLLSNANVFLRAVDKDVNWVRGPVEGDTTERIYFTSFRDDPSGAATPAVPKVTNFAKATGVTIHTGQTDGNYPNDWLLLGVPEPTVAPTFTSVASVPTMVLSYDGSNLNGWTVTNNIAISSTVGNPAPSLQLTSGGAVGSAKYAHKNFSLNDGAHFRRLDCQVRVNTPGLIDVFYAIDDTGKGYVAELRPGADTFAFRVSDGFTIAGSGGTSEGTLGLAYDTFYTIRFIDEASVTGARTISAQLFNADNDTAISGKLTFNTTGTDIGPEFGVRTYNLSGTGELSFLDNVKIGTLGTTSTLEFTSYVYTWVNELGDESAPSPASIIKEKADGIHYTLGNISNPTAAQITDYGLVSPGEKRLYRSATGPDGVTAYFFVKAVAHGTTTVVDDVDNNDLGEELESTDWELPPADGHSIIVLPNGITAIASKNQIFLSETNRPHAYNPDNALTCDFPVVGLGSIDSTLIILTQANPYIAMGSTPDQFTMAKLEIPYGCSSKRSIAHLQGFGVIYASPDGLVSINGNGVNLITDQFFSREQWRDIIPESIHGFVHNDRYFFFYDATS